MEIVGLGFADYSALRTVFETIPEVTEIGTRQLTETEIKWEVLTGLTGVELAGRLAGASIRELTLTVTDSSEEVIHFEAR